MKPGFLVVAEEMADMSRFCPLLVFIIDIEHDIDIEVSFLRRENMLRLRLFLLSNPRDGLLRFVAAGGASDFVVYCSLLSLLR